MEGTRRAATIVAWEAEWFTRQKRLQPLAHYLKKAGKPASGAGDVLAMLRQAKKRGVPMQIRRIAKR